MRHTYRSIACLAASTVLLFACNARNPVDKVKPDEFAQLVNQFSLEQMEDSSFFYCGKYYIDPKEVSKSMLYKLSGKKQFEAFCHKEFTSLAAYLPQHSPIKNITANDLEQASVWNYYFQSAKAQKFNFSE